MYTQAITAKKKKKKQERREENLPHRQNSLLNWKSHIIIVFCFLCSSIIIKKNIKHYSGKAAVICIRPGKDVGVKIS